MKKQLILLMVLFLLLPFSIKAVGESYVITDYNVKIKVNHNNKCEVKESFKVFFNTQKQGFERLFYKSSNEEKVTDIKIEDKFTSTDEVINNQKFQIIKIGDPNEYIISEKDYSLEYTYNLDYDKVKDYDEYTYLLGGNEWNTSIENILFEIEFPDNINSKDVSISINDSSNKVNFQVMENKLIGTYNILGVNETLTLKVVLPEGYFLTENEASISGKKLKNDLNITILCFSTFIFIITILLLKFYNRGTAKIKANHYPPRQCNSTEVGFFLKRSLDSNMVSTYIISLANKGYIKIKKTSNEEMTVSKIKNYDGNNPLEKVFMDELFMNENEIGGSNLSRKMLTMITPLISNFEQLVKNNKFFILNKKRKKIILGLLISILVINNVLTFIPNNILTILLGLITKSFVELLMVAIMIKANNLIKMIVSIPFILLLGYFDYYFCTLLTVDITRMLISLYALVISLIIGYRYNKVSLRTPQGNQIAKETLSFKHFIEIAREKDINKELNSNPNYFYDVLPFMLSLKIKPALMYKFSGIFFYLPSWYEGEKYTNYKDFYNYLYHTLELLVKQGISPLREIKEESKEF